VSEKKRLAELARIIRRAIERPRTIPEQQADMDGRQPYLEAARAAAAACGFELAPEPAEVEWPEWWGEERRPGQIKFDNREIKALVAAYDAARKAGVLPGLEGQAGNPWLSQVAATETAAYRRYQAQRNEQMAALGMHFAEPSDAELARRARAAKRRLTEGGGPAIDALADVASILDGAQPAGPPLPRDRIAEEQERFRRGDGGREGV
jgi:hypothetical protein